MENLQPLFSLAALLATIIVAAKVLLPLVKALVEFSKKFPFVRGWVCNLLSVLFGLLIGIFCYIAVYGVPTALWHWFALLMSGLVLGLAASGDYDLENPTWIISEDK